MIKAFFKKTQRKFFSFFGFLFFIVLYEIIGESTESTKNKINKLLDNIKMQSFLYLNSLTWKIIFYKV